MTTIQQCWRRSSIGASAALIAACTLGCALLMVRSVSARESDYDDLDDGGGSSISVSFFHRTLAPYGEWVRVADYGDVWRPTGVRHDWRPYTDGYWELTDYGWTWTASEEWGWAPFHYGRWIEDGAYGWVWVPGTVWGPAWVAWRYGGDWVGWAPLPPQVRWRVGIGLDLGGVDLGVSLHQGAWSFVQSAHFLAPNVRTVMVSRARYHTLFPVTRVSVIYRVDHERIVNGGLPVEHIQHAMGRPVRRVPVVDVDTPTRGRAAPSRHEVPIYRPIFPHGVPVSPTPLVTPSGRAQAAPVSRREPTAMAPRGHPAGPRTGERPVVAPSPPAGQAPRKAVPARQNRGSRKGHEPKRP